VDAIPKTEFKAVRVDRINDTARYNYNMHGVKLVFITTGLVSRFDFQTALIQVGLLPVHVGGSDRSSLLTPVASLCRSLCLHWV